MIESLKQEKVHLQPRDAPVRADDLPGLRQGAQEVPFSDHPHRDCAAPGVVMGHDLPAGRGGGPLVPLDPDPRPLQLQDRRREVHDTDSADPAVLLVRRAVTAEGIAELTVKPVLRGDNGATLNALTVLATL